MSACACACVCMHMCLCVCTCTDNTPIVVADSFDCLMDESHE